MATLRDTVAAAGGRGSRVDRLLYAVAGVCVVVAVWWMLSWTTDPIRIPSPALVVEAFVDGLYSIDALGFVSFGTGGIAQNLVYTAVNVIVGVAIGAAIGLILGVLIGRVRVIRDALEVPLLFLGTVPVLVLLPFLSLWFGSSRVATSGLVVFYSIVTVALGAQQATLNVSGYFEQYAQTLGASKVDVLYRVVLPAIVPEVLGSIRVALAYGWGFQAIAEILGGQVGAGRIVRVFSQSYATADMLAVVAAVGVLAVLVDGMVATAGRWVTRWQE